MENTIEEQIKRIIDRINETNERIDNIVKRIERLEDTMIFHYATYNELEELEKELCNSCNKNKK